MASFSDPAQSLRLLLCRVDGTAPSIHAAAGAMMKQYDRTSQVAVNEWRNALQTSQPEQLLPLLYVINEVLQNSKRNRGPKFLEATSPILGKSLQYMCATAGDPAVTEKVRRTVKIWADRHVWSIRFVNELLQGLEPYRQHRQHSQQAAAGHSPSLPTPSFSPGPAAPTTASPAHTTNTSPDAASPDDDEIRGILASSDDEDDDDIFGQHSSSQKLEIEFNLGSALEASTTNTASSAAAHKKVKRRRSSMSSGSEPTSSSHPHHHRRRKSSVLTVSNMSDLWNGISDLQQQLEASQSALQRMDDRHATVTHAALETMVGDELQQQVVMNERDMQLQAVERARLHAIATQLHAAQAEAVRYLLWLESNVQQDAADLQFCDELEQKIASFQDIHASMKQARQKLRDEEEKQKKLQLERDRLQKEREEQEKFKQQALARETEAKPGMVWNPTTREYQSLNTDESWRE